MGGEPSRLSLAVEKRYRSLSEGKLPTWLASVEVGASQACMDGRGGRDERWRELG
jgi:hypothetical protein